MGKHFVAKELDQKAKLFQQRAALYGDNYMRFGKVFTAMFPNGLMLETEAEFTRFALFVHSVTKTTRYAENFKRGGHDDSLDDNSVYSMMLKQADAHYKKGRRK